MRRTLNSLLCPLILASIYLEFFGELVQETAEMRPSLWLRYVDSNFIAWPQTILKPNHQFLQHLNSVRPNNTIYHGGGGHSPSWMSGCPVVGGTIH